MKFRCEREALEKALAIAGRAVSSRGGSLPVLSGVHLELNGNQLQLTGSDLDLTISVTMDVAGDTDGVAVLPAKLAADIVRAVADGKIELGVSDDEAHISAGRSEFSLRVIPADEFPQIAGPSAEAVELDAGVFKDALRQVIPAASSDDSRPILTGVLMAAEEGGLRLVATDSYRLSVRDLPGSTVLGSEQSVLVPSRSLNELA
ncbi:MAG: DNA polymerase III subunit beta, partial [Acidimicrobiales bacterium]|nr:DNA polymerase III subunit beta [Acidimicrobiales bacterium]